MLSDLEKLLANDRNDFIFGELTCPICLGQLSPSAQFHIVEEVLFDDVLVPGGRHRVHSRCWKGYQLTAAEAEREKQETGLPIAILSELERGCENKVEA